MFVPFSVIKCFYNFIYKSKQSLGRRVFQFSLSFFFFFEPSLLFLSSFPLIFSMSEGSEFDTFGDGHFVYPFELEVGVDGIKKVKFILYDERVFFILIEVRE